jgi:hypothetical protein
MPSRREFLAGAVALAVTACTGKSNPRPSGPRSPSRLPSGPITIDDLQAGAPQLSLLGVGPGAIGGDPKDPLQTGKPFITFDLSTEANLIGGGTPLVYVAKEPTDAALGPFKGQWGEFTAYGKTGDHSPKSPIPGVYTAQIDLPSPGLWTIAAVGPGGRVQGVGVTHVYAAKDVLGGVGAKAIPVKTPVATTDRELREVCTRTPPDPMHAISLDVALRNGKPTVAVFATPRFCESKLCGPVTDEALLVFQDVGAAKANFIHLEEFLPGPSLQPDASTQSAAFRAWHLRTEPWIFVIDADGVIRARFEGSITAPVIDAALRPLL